MVHLLCHALCLRDLTTDFEAHNCVCSNCYSSVIYMYHNSCYPDGTFLSCRYCSPVSELNFHSSTDDSVLLIYIDPQNNLAPLRRSFACQYFNVNKFNSHFQALLRDKVSLIHINSSSLQSNFNSLYSQMYHVLNRSSDVIGITETWLKSYSWNELL